MKTISNFKGVKYNRSRRHSLTVKAEAVVFRMHKAATTDSVAKFMRRMATPIGYGHKLKKVRADSVVFNPHVFQYVIVKADRTQKYFRQQKAIKPFIFTSYQPEDRWFNGIIPEMQKQNPFRLRRDYVAQIPDNSIELDTHPVLFYDGPKRNTLMDEIGLWPDMQIWVPDRIIKLDIHEDKCKGLFDWKECLQPRISLKFRWDLYVGLYILDAEKLTIIR